MTSGLVSAGELRACGLPVPDSIPNCAEVPRHAIRFGTRADVKYNAETKQYEFNLELKFTEPFRWIAGTFSVEKKP